MTNALPYTDTINKLPRRTAQVPARRPGITIGQILYNLKTIITNVKHRDKTKCLKLAYLSKHEKLCCVPSTMSMGISRVIDMRRRNFSAFARTATKHRQNISK